MARLDPEQASFFCFTGGANTLGLPTQAALTAVTRGIERVVALATMAQAEGSADLRPALARASVDALRGMGSVVV